MISARLTLGPLMFHWSAEKRRDFYFRIADEAKVDVVYLGEVACSKREPLFEKYENEVIKRLQSAGKQVVMSSLAMVTTPREMQSIRQKTEDMFLVEANDVAAIQALSGRPFIVGPFVNVMNEGTRDYLIRLGAKRIVFSSEISEESIGILTNGSVETEVQVFGRQPLSVSMRCYAARAYGRNKDNCKFACGNDPDGLSVMTIDGQQILSVFGTGTMSYGYVVLLRELSVLKKQGVTHFRLSPQNIDMVKVIDIYRAVMDGTDDPDSALDSLGKIANSVSFINGYFYGKRGIGWESR